jgi:hypothetical protein
MTRGLSEEAIRRGLAIDEMFPARFDPDDRDCAVATFVR